MGFFSLNFLSMIHVADMAILMSNIDSFDDNQISSKLLEIVLCL